MSSRAIEREAAAKGQQARSPEPVTREAVTTASPTEHVLTLQRSAGNRATARLLQRFPEEADIDSFWSALDNPGALDCREATNRLAGIGRSQAKRRGIKANREPLKDALYRISKDDYDAEPWEAKEAHNRGWRVRDRVVSAFGRDYMKVWSGGAEGATPTVKFYPLLPGMMIYTAENAGYTSKKKNTYHWYRRHAAAYKGDGEVRENFGDQTRNIKEGHRNKDTGRIDEDEWGAWDIPRDPRRRKPEDPKFFTTLAIYDPFYAYRSKAEVAWFGHAPMSAPWAAWDAATRWLPWE